jgi:hypothetical protein
MFESFSNSYYVGRLYVKPESRDIPAINEADHEEVNAHVYGPDGVVRTDAPLVMKLNNSHVPVMGDASIPTGTLAVPSAMGGTNLPAEQSVLLAKSDRAAELLRYSGYRFGDDSQVA